MIGYYVHHQGSGHLHRALAVARAWVAQGGEVTGLSSAERPREWPGPWVRLPLEDVTDPAVAVDPTAGGALHWAPRGDGGLLARQGAISGWLASARPRAFVVDVSAEVAWLVRLHGVPTVTVVQPGHRADDAHLAAYRSASALVAPWPAAAEQRVAGGFTPRLPLDVRTRVQPVGAISRLGTTGLDAGPARPAPDPGHAVVLQGRGGGRLTEESATDLGRRLPRWRWTVLGGGGTWVEDPAAVLASAGLVVAQAGLGSLADVAALRRPAVVVPFPRPYDEQHATARVLAAGDWPVVVAASGAEALREETLDAAAALDGEAWRGWVDPDAPARVAKAVAEVALP
ncbi:hypothetical protein ASG49_16550 [Marmoricola sp. Leaf446]|uniref:glycosyltransferase n=1 Tax=Marmoricola sp. Leaf446 TaxID=1736379 RepID=UPI0006F4CB79|nr:glycosyltransferase [Marmoricola sp. Leaf446]KQT89380.1 hypothetical protein ASG49_16550 [Marmoricola sp. Leaf446]